MMAIVEQHIPIYTQHPTKKDIIVLACVTLQTTSSIFLWKHRNRNLFFKNDNEWSGPSGIILANLHIVLLSHLGWSNFHEFRSIINIIHPYHSMFPSYDMIFPLFHWKKQQKKRQFLCLFQQLEGMHLGDNTFSVYVPT